MTKLTPWVQSLARQLLGQEGAHLPNNADAAESAWAKLRAFLVELIGEEGFRVLLVRALVLAKGDAPSLAPVQVNAEGFLEGLAEADPREDTDQVDESSVTLLAHFLALLVTFIGETLTLRLVREMWPETPLDYSLPILNPEATA